MNTQELLTRIEKLERSISLLSKSFKFLDIEELTVGRGDTSLKIGPEGIWLGKNKFTQATTGGAGTAIAMNGDIYPKGGVSGSFISADGTPKTITVTRGIISSIT